MAIPIAIVGAGRRGREWLRAVAADPAYRLAAVVEPEPAAAAAAAVASEVVGAGARVCASLEEACAATTVTAAIVVTPVDAHVAPCETALDRGLAVLVEKPFTTSLEAARRLVVRAAQRSIPLLVAQNYRYMRAFRTARRIVQDGQIGRLLLVTAQYYRVPHDMAPSLARLDDTVLWGMAVHHFDALRSVLGRNAARVVAESFSARAEPGRPRGGSLRALMTFDTDIRVTYTATYESSGHEYFEGGQEFYCRLVGEAGTLHVWHRWLVLCRGGALPRVIRRGARTRAEEAVLLDQLRRAVEQGEPPEVSGHDNLETMAIVEACRQSSRDGAWVDVSALR